MTWFKRNRTTLLLLLMMILGLGLLLYPTVSNYWNKLHQSRIIVDYMKSVSNLDQARYDELLKSAQDYNAKLAKSGILWHMDDAQRAEYEQQLDFAENGSMGYVSIPKINVELAIFHGTDLRTLDRNVGHIEGSSLPVGGKGSHCILSGHRGLPSARLFTDLDKLTVGDTFTLHVLEQVYTYEVDQIRIVEPADVSDLAIAEGKDYCTLVTCTPYGINTHRLLVRGHRIQNQPSARRIAADAAQIDTTLVAIFIGAVFVILLVVMLLLASRRKRRNRNDNVKRGRVYEKE